MEAENRGGRDVHRQRGLQGHTQQGQPLLSSLERTGSLSTLGTAGASPGRWWDIVKLPNIWPQGACSSSTLLDFGDLFPFNNFQGMWLLFPALS